MHPRWRTLCLALLGLLAAAPPLAAQEAVGDWIGEMDSGFRVRLKIERSADGYRAVMTNPSGQATELDTVSADHGRLRFGMTALGLAYDGAWDDAAGRWNGTLRYQGAHPMTFRRATAAELAPKVRRRPQEDAVARAPAAYASREVAFANGAADITLAGTLRLPQGKGPFPAVVLISGTGANTRDEEVEGHKVFLVLADALARRGVAVLSYDKRGVGASSGAMRDATTTDFASDAAAAVSFLRTQAAIDATRIGLLGHSEGGIVAPMVAAGDRGIAYVVLMAAPGVRGDRLLVQQAAAVARVQGAPAAYIARRQAFDEAVYAAILAAPSAQAARADVAALATKGAADGVLDAAEAASLATDTTTVWGRHFIALDPAASLRRLTVPVLAVGGALDIQVPARENLAAIRAALSANAEATVIEAPGLNHLLQTARTGAPAEYGDIDETIAPDALRLIGDWIVAHSGPLDIDTVRARLSDRTTIAGSGPDRWQVEYTAPDGAVYQWQPGVAVLAGRWSVRDDRGEAQVCFTYPVELVIPGEEKCGDAAYPLGLAGKVALESRPGDVFGLASGKAPPLTGGKPVWPAP